VTGIIAAIIVSSIGGFIILVVVICCCCWCRRRRQARLDKEALVDQYAEHDYYKQKSVEETAPKTTERRRELEKKYGLKPRV
jgi:hypothetical protein